MGGDPQRHGAGQGPTLRLRVLDLQRLWPAADPAGAIMEIPVIYVFTHDSIGVGEDGPTHQPIEQLPSLRAIPGLIMLRPGRRQRSGRGLEGHHAAAPRAGGPDPDPAGAARRSTAPSTPRPRALAKGAYVLADAAGGKPEVLCWPPAARCRCASRPTRSFKAEGIQSPRGEHAVVGTVRRPGRGLPRQVLPPDVTARVSVEQASTFGWAQYVGLDGHSIGMKTFGASAPLKDLEQEFGFSVDRVVESAKEQVKRVKA